MEHKREIKRIATVIHIGAKPPLTPRNSPPRNSQEGPLLSVSRTPVAWELIAKLGGGIWTSLRRKDGRALRFLDFHKITNRAAHLRSAEAAGLVQAVTLWKAFETDEEGNTRFSIHPDEETAIKNTEPGAGRPKRFRTWLCREKLARFWQSEGTPSAFHTEAALHTYLASQTPDLDGVWWNDVHDPWNLSSPRGGIFQHRLPELEQKETPKHSALL